MMLLPHLDKNGGKTARIVCQQVKYRRQLGAQSVDQGK